ncbi:MgtC/SapB family protein [Candidatus Gracilibacteria bacterium]|nr:MgtC/SapB family protein [Candidatus Gracilibacteria bacterium]
MEQSLFWSFLLATSLGALFGVEREMPWSGTKPGGAVGFGGIRSFALLSLIGAIASWLDTTLGSGNLWKSTGFIMTSIIIISGYVYSSFHQHRMGVTSEFAGILTYLIGMIVMTGSHTIAVILSILILILLSAKDYLAKLRERFSREELGDSLKFAVIALVILPLLPDHKFSILNIVQWFYSGNLGWDYPILITPFFNPWKIWFFVVIMAGVEYAGFILSRVIGAKGGIVAAGAVGGLISSTATTVAMTKKSKEHPENCNTYVVGTLVASCIMFLRVIIMAGGIYFSILTTIWIPATIMLVGLLIMTFYYYIQSRKETTHQSNLTEKKEYESPFQLLPAIQFAGLIVLINFLSIVAKAFEHIIPPEISNYGIALISGLADVDGINATYSGNARDGVTSLIIASTTILIAVMSNNIVKASIAYRFGEKEFGKRVFLGFGVSIIAGIIAIVMMNILG